MKSSIGTTTPDTDADRDVDGIPDQAERDFAEDGKTSPAARRREAPSKPAGTDDAPDDGGLESTRSPHGDVVPPPSN